MCQQLEYMPRNTESAQVHLRLITAMVNKLMTEGYKVSADHIGYPNGKPPEFNNFVPDIYAKKDDKKVIIEAETCDSLEDDHTRVQWTALSTMKDISFWVIVPQKCHEKAKELREKWGLHIETIWTLDV